MNIENKVKALEEQMKIDKEFFFNNPEIGLEEFKTSEYIIKRLKEIGYEDINSKIYETGIVATLETNKEGPCVLFRCDMDAIVLDENGTKRHSCGHDAHMTIMLSLAKLLMDSKEILKGSFKLLFEPDEEGFGGANNMIKNGALENPIVDKVFALHVWSELKEDTVAIKTGALMASTDPFEITVLGKGGHAAIPEKCIDPIYIANKIAIMIKDLSNDEENLDNKIVTGITAISAGKNNNVIPNEAHMKGICRTFNNIKRDEIKNKLIEITNQISEEHGAQAEFKFVGNYPVVENSEIEANEIKEIAEQVVENIDLNYRTMCSEDFSYFLKEKPGAMFLIGCQENEYYPQHSKNFNVGINSILIGTQIFYNIAKKYLMN